MSKRNSGFSQSKAARCEHKQKHQQFKTERKHKAKRVSRLKKQSHKHYQKQRPKQSPVAVSELWTNSASTHWEMPELVRPVYRYSGPIFSGQSNGFSINGFIFFLFNLSLYLTGVGARELDPSVLNFARTMHHDIRTDFSSGAMTVCNKASQSMMVRNAVGVSEMIGLPEVLGSFEPCVDRMIDMRREVPTRRQIKQKRRQSLPAKVRHNKSCDSDRVQSFADALLESRSHTEVSKEHKVTHCGELAHRVMTEFMESSDASLTQENRIGMIVLVNPLTGEDHVFNVIFSADHVPNAEERKALSLAELAERFPEAQVIDLWNHLSMPLGHFNQPKQFKRSVKRGLRYVMYDGDEVGGRHSTSHPTVYSAGERHADGVRAYYFGLTHCQVELAPPVPVAECRF